MCQKYLRSKFLGLLFLLSLTNSFSQKANLETVRMYCSSAKYEEAYDVLKSEKFKYKDSEKGEYYYFTAFVCSGLYEKNKEINSPYRNEGIFYAKDAMACDVTEWQDRGKEIVTYLTSTIYKDFYDISNAKPEEDSVSFDAFTTETLLAFEEFIIPDSWNEIDIYAFGTRFYNDAVFLLQTKSVSGDSEEDRDNKMRYIALIFNARKYFKILCHQYQVHCDILETISN